MTAIQRMKSDIATTDRREMEDEAVRDHRQKNDEITMERRFKADRDMEHSRIRNDELTANRRETKDGSPAIALTVLLLMLLSFGVGAFFILV